MHLRQLICEGGRMLIAYMAIVARRIAGVASMKWAKVSLDMAISRWRRRHDVENNDIGKYFRHEANFDDKSYQTIKCHLCMLTNVRIERSAKQSSGTIRAGDR